MNQAAFSASASSLLQPPSATAPRDNLALPKALLSILVVIGAWFAMGTAYGALIGDVFIGGYEVKFSVLISLILTAAVVYWVKKTRGSLASLGFKRPQSWWRSGLVAIGMVIAIYASITAIMTGLSAIGMMPAAPQDPSGMLVQGPSLAISLTFSLALMWACAAFGEELLFRGYLQSNLERALGGENWRNGLVAALVVSLSFGAMHVPSQGMYGLIVTGVVGFLLGLFYLAGKRSLFRVVMAHGLINTTSFALFAASA